MISNVKTMLMTRLLLPAPKKILLVQLLLLLLLIMVKLLLILLLLLLKIIRRIRHCSRDGRENSKILLKAATTVNSISSNRTTTTPITIIKFYGSISQSTWRGWVHPILSNKYPRFFHISTQYWPLLGSPGAHNRELLDSSAPFCHLYKRPISFALSHVVPAPRHTLQEKKMHYSLFYFSNKTCNGS